MSVCYNISLVSPLQITGVKGPLKSKKTAYTKTWANMPEEDGIMKKKFITIALLAVLAFTLAIGPGCGMVFWGTSNNVTIRSLPEGAKVTVDGSEYATPVVLKLKKSDDHLIKFEKAGYEPKTVLLGRHLNVSALVLDICLTCILGVVVDFVTGGVYTFDQTEITAQLDKVGARLDLPPPGPDEFYLVLADQAQVDTLNAAVAEHEHQ